MNECRNEHRPIWYDATKGPCPACSIRDKLIVDLKRYQAAHSESIGAIKEAIRTMNAMLKTTGDIGEDRIMHPAEKGQGDG